MMTKLAAWLVHGLTASGAVWGFLALEAAFRAEPVATFGWLAIAFLVDGLDGPLARHFRVHAVVPQIDGAILDLVIDYLTYVVVPAAYLYSAGTFPPELAAPLTGLILVTSLYTFARRDMKSDTADFRGFPAVWNLVAAAFVATQADSWTATLVTIALAALTFTSLKAVHPVRVLSLRPLTLGACAMWLAASTVLIAWPEWQRSAALGLWWIATTYVVGLCIARSWAEYAKGAP